MPAFTLFSQTCVSRACFEEDVRVTLSML